MYLGVDLRTEGMRGLQRRDKNEVTRSSGTTLETLPRGGALRVEGQAIKDLERPAKVFDPKDNGEPLKKNF